MPHPFVARLLQFDRSLISKRVAFRGALATSVALAVGHALGGPVVGVVVAVGALDTSFADAAVAVRLRLMRISFAAIAVTLAAAIGSTTGAVAWLAIPAVAAWAFAAGLVVCLGPDATTAGILSLVVFIVLGRTPLDPAHALGVALLVLAGGGITMLVSAVAVPSRATPQQRALARAYEHLAELARQPVAAMPPLSAPLADAAAILAAFGRARGTADEPLRTLLDLAERLRAELVTLRTWASEPALAAGAASSALGDALEAAGGACERIARELVARDAAGAPAAELARIAAARERLAAADAAGHTPLGAATLRALDALAGQLRAAVRAAGDVRARGTLARARTALRPPVPPVRGAFVTIRANLTLRSTALRHALRLAVCVAVAEAIERALAIPRGYWIPMTAALVLRPDFTETFARGLLRVGGTLVGIAIAFPLDLAFGGTELGRIALVFLGVFATRSLGRSHYGALTASVTLVVAVLLSYVGQSPGVTLEERTVATLAGGALGLAFYALWPTWERTLAPAVVATLLDRYVRYWRAIVAEAASAEEPDDPELGEIRIAARLARSNAEASVARMRGEPGHGDAVDLYAGIVASAHRFVLCGIRLEALAGTGLARERGVAAFATDVETTVVAFARALRDGRPVGELPDLRRDQQRLATAASDDASRFFASEADDVADALDTIAALLGRLGARRRRRRRARIARVAALALRRRARRARGGMTPRGAG